MDPFWSALSRRIWDTKYRSRDGEVVHDQTVEDTWRRVARALAEAEPSRLRDSAADHAAWTERFYQALAGFRFLPGGRILAGAGTAHRVTLFNCFVMGVIEDSMDGIFDALKEGALTMQQGGGVGYDFSTLRPRGAVARAGGATASGPVSFMEIWDRMCATILSTGVRRGAMMATLRCDHPDILEFVEAKRTPERLRHFNLSVQVFDDLMDAVQRDGPWPLVFPAERLGGPGGETVLRRWTGAPGPVLCRVVRTIPARELWGLIMRSTYDYAEPGVLFVDRINRLDNLGYREHLTATNPCGEIPLPPYGACDLGSLNLTSFVVGPFTAGARLDLDGLRDAAALATRMLDDVIDVSRFPLPAQERQARGTRRIGLGITGLGDALIMLGLHYGEAQARELAAEAMRTVCHAAYRTSIELARQKGSFPFFDRERFLAGEFVRALPEEIRRGIAEVGIRNSHLTAIAPAGTISLLANNISSGLEPVFAFSFRRRVLELDGSWSEHELTDHALELWRRRGGRGPLPACFVDARHLSPEAHLAMQAALQPYVDNSVSKTINVPQDYDFAAFQGLYTLAFERGLKGCTTFRSNPVTGQVLEAEEGPRAPERCCGIEREAD